MPELILPCHACGSTNVYVRGRSNAQVTCRACGMEGPEFCGPNQVIAAWNALPRMSTIIAWQFQAAGAALALQRLMDAAQVMRETQQAWENLIGVDDGTRMQAACKLCDAEDAFDDTLSAYRRAQRVI